MKPLRTSLMLLIFAVLLSVQSAHATTLDGKKYGIGLQVVDPAVAGIGMTIDLKKRPVSLEPILGVDPFPTAAFRLRYAFMRKRYLDGYGYGMVGGNNNGFFGGVGAGVEWDWRNLDKTLPPISWSFELGYNKDRFSAGLGILYSF